MFFLMLLKVEMGFAADDSQVAALQAGSYWEMRAYMQIIVDWCAEMLRLQVSK